MVDWSYLTEDPSSVGHDKDKRGRLSYDPWLVGISVLAYAIPHLGTQGSPMPFISADQITPLTIDWLWKGWLACGHLHMLDGDPGLGKSLVTIDLAARLTTGRSFPETTAAVEPAAAIILNAEDGAQDTLRPRLAAAEADLTRVHLWERRPGESDIRLPHAAGQLDRLLTATGARRVILDPLLAFLDPATNIGSDPEVRLALAPLTDLAHRHRCAIVLLRHLNKRSGGQAMYRGLASIAFLAACRLAWLIARDPTDRTRCVLTQTKNNLAPRPPSLLYRIAAAAPAPPHLDWLGPSALLDTDLLGHERPPSSALLQAREFLTHELGNGPRLRGDVHAAARTAGITKRMLIRAFKELSCCRDQIGFGRHQEHYWRLREQPKVRPRVADDVVEECFREMEAWVQAQDPT